VQLISSLVEFLVTVRIIARDVNETAIISSVINADITRNYIEDQIDYLAHTIQDLLQTMQSRPLEFFIDVGK
jgi:hypothetical protein